MGTLWMPPGYKPRPGQLVDWDARAMPRPVGEWWLNEGEGDLIFDASGTDTTLTLSGAATRDSEGNLVCDANEEQASGAAPLSLQVPLLTLVWRGKLLGTPTNNVGFAGVVRDPSNAPYEFYAFDAGPLGNQYRVRLGCALGGSFVGTIQTDINAWAIGETATWVGTIETNRQRIYKNGALLINATNVGVVSGYANAKVELGCRVAEARNSNTSTEYMMIFDDAFHPVRVAALEGPVPIWQPQRYWWMAVVEPEVLSGTIALTGGGSAAGSAVSPLTSTLALTGGGSAAGTVVTPLTGTLAITGDGSAAGTGVSSLSGTLAVAGDGSAAGVIGNLLTGTLPIAGDGSAAGLAVSILSGNLAISGEGGAAGTIVGSLSGTLTATGDGIAAGQPIGQLSGSLAIVGSGSAGGTVTVQLSGTLTAIGGGSTAGTAVVPISGTMALAGGGSAAGVEATPTPTLSGTLVIAGGGSAAGIPVAVLTGTISVTGSGSVAMGDDLVDYEILQIDYVRSDLRMDYSRDELDTDYGRDILRTA